MTKVPRSAWAGAVLVVAAAPMFMAAGSVLVGWWQVDADTLRFIASTTLPRVAPTTLLLGIAVPLLAGVLGTAAAWLTAVCDFPLRRALSVALVLPLAIPGYLLATVYIGWLDYAGPVQTALRSLWPGAGLPPIRSTGGAAITLALALYPYVYLLARGAFLTQGQRSLEVAQSLGLGRWAGFWRLSLPLARPWIAGAMLLVLMEALADFGTVAAFNVDTFTTAIYQTWFSLFSAPGALALASVLVLIALGVAAGERRMRARQSFAMAGSATVRRTRLSGLSAWAACGGLTTLVLIAAVGPLVQLAHWAWVWRADFDARWLGFLGNTVLLAGVAAVALTVLAAAVVAVRRGGHLWQRGLAQFAQGGYSVPGAVLAIALFIPLAAVSSALNALPGISGVALQAGLATLLLAYAARFLAVAASPVEAGLMRVSPRVEDAARNLGLGGGAVFWRVQLPLLRGGMAAAAALVFVDVAKELPMTLMTRPFGWDTLAVRVFERTAEGEWARAAVPGIGIALVSLVPVWWLLGASERSAVARKPRPAEEAGYALAA